MSKYLPIGMEVISVKLKINYELPTMFSIAGRVFVYIEISNSQ